MTLNTHRESADTAWLKEVFPVDLAQFEHRFVSDPTRQLDWVLRGSDASAWIELATGSLVLVEAIGGEESGAGYVTARLWLAPAERELELTKRVSYVEEVSDGGIVHSTALEQVLEAVLTRVPGLTAQGSE